MSGGGADAPPPSSSLDGGAFLLKILQNPPQQPRHRQPTQPLPRSIPSDPAVAAVGPTISSYQSNHRPDGHEHLSNRFNLYQSPAGFAPHNFFMQNPNPNLAASVSPPGFDQRYQQSHQVNQNGGFDGNHNLNGGNMMFGSFPSNSIYNNSNAGESNGSHFGRNDRGVVGGGGYGSRIPNALNIEFQKSLDLNRNMEPNGRPFLNHGGVSGRNIWGNAPVGRSPPGFSGNSRIVGDKSGSFERNRGKGKGKYGELNHRNVVNSVSKEERERREGGRMSGETRVIGQLDRPGLPAGSNLHSVPASDFEESLVELHNEVRRARVRGDGDEVSTELDDLDERGTGTLAPEDESAEKSDKKKQRDKDYRSDKRGAWILNQRMRISRRQIECRSDINALNAPFLSIYESLIPSEEEKAKQKQLLALLEKHVTKEWPEARLFLYGSCANSFGFRKSDIDVCLAIEDSDVNKSEVLLKLAEILQADNLQNVQALTHARVPIVKLMDPVTGISCDICVNNLLAVINTKLLRDYAHIDARLRQLAFIVKHWAKLRGVNETYQGTLSSYAYVLMCIHFLQQRTPAILPCLQGMERTYSVNVDNTECGYFDQVEKLRGFGSRNRESIAELVWGFFSYWAYYHDYTNEVISVRTGSILSKHEKDWTRRIGNDRHLICIEDPFEISHDLGRVVDKYSIRVLREEFERAAEIMQNDPDPCVTLFQPYIPG